MYFCLEDGKKHNEKICLFAFYWFLPACCGFTALNSTSLVTMLKTDGRNAKFSWFILLLRSCMENIKTFLTYMNFNDWCANMGTRMIYPRTNTTWFFYFAKTCFETSNELKEIGVHKIYGSNKNCYTDFRTCEL